MRHSSGDSTSAAREFQGWNSTVDICTAHIDVGDRRDAQLVGRAVVARESVTRTVGHPVRAPPSGSRFWCTLSPSVPVGKRCIMQGRSRRAFTIPSPDGQVVVREIEFRLAALREIHPVRVGQAHDATVDLDLGRTALGCVRHERTLSEVLPDDLHQRLPVPSVTRRIVVVGGDATGMSAASTALRHGGTDAYEVVVLERGHYTSYSACGIPYWIAGEVPDGDDLIARSPEQHREAGIDLRMRTEATAIDLDEQVVSFRAVDGDGSDGQVEYDDLVLATGARPTVPPLEGVDAEGIFGVQSLEDGEAIIKALTGSDARKAVVVGAGYIGVEMAEAMLQRGLEVTVVDQAPEPFTQIDPDMGALVREAMDGMGITVLTSTPVEGFDVGDDGRVCAVRTGEGALEADIVVLGLGVAPNVDLARDAGLTIGESGGIATDVRMRAVGHENVWAGGDCVETHHRLSGRGVAIALGTHANKHGRIIGINLAGGYGAFPGVIGTAISKVCSLEIGRTGLGEAEARAAGFGFVTTTIESSNVAGYFPGAEMMTIKVLAEQRSGRLLGAQIVGRANSAKRIDVFATAIWNNMGVEELTFMDLSYAPPFSPTWDAVLVTARKATKEVEANSPASPA